MDLKLKINGARLEVVVLNTTTQPIRLWELDNSWGWYSVSIKVKPAAPDAEAVIRRKSREWTKNGPTWFELGPGESRTIVVDLHDEWWEIGDISGLENEELLVCASLQIDWSPEAENFGVFVGSASSDWVMSTPPHSWLWPPH